LRLQPQPRGRVLAGEVRFRLRRNPDTTVGIDLAYVSPELAANTPDDARFVDGAPVQAVEILSPSNTQKRMLAKVKEYLSAGVQLVWAVEPEFRTVTVYRPHAEPELFNVKQHLEGGPQLPGLRIAVADIFDF
jgi:Uma2 family endonuclease